MNHLDALMIVSSPRPSRRAGLWETSICPMRGLASRSGDFERVQKGGVVHMVDNLILADIMMGDAAKRVYQLCRTTMASFSGDCTLQDGDLLVRAGVPCVIERFGCRLMDSGWEAALKDIWIPVQLQAQYACCYGWIRVGDPGLRAELIFVSPSRATMAPANMAQATLEATALPIRIECVQFVGEQFRNGA
jgi:hypothetical protein